MLKEQEVRDLLKGPKKLQLEETLEESSEEESSEKDVIVKTFIPKERKDPTKTMHTGWYEPMHPNAIKQLMLMLEHAYEHTKGSWEMEERISKQRKEYLQNLYEKLTDVRIVHAQQLLKK